VVRIPTSLSSIREEQASVIAYISSRGAFPFFKLPVDELHNQHVGLDDLWGTEAGLLRERFTGSRHTGR